MHQSGRSLATANDEAMLASDLKVDNYVALCDSDDPEYNQFHVARVLRIDADAGEAQLHQYATKAAKLQQAVWLPLFEWRRRDPHDATKQVHTYRMGGKEDAKYKPVLDTVELDDPTDEFPYVRHCELQMLGSNKLAATSRHQLSDKNLQHHRLGATYE